MRKVIREPDFIPQGLAEKKAQELAAAQIYFADPREKRKKKKKVVFTAYKLASVKAELERMFGGKCAYCESHYNHTAPVDIEHYRPKGEVQEDKTHDGYWWLAAEWTNLLPSCIDCNRKRRQPTPRPGAELLPMVTTGEGGALTNTGKKDSFPIAEGAIRARADADDLDRESPLLLDPCKVEPEEFLDFSYDPAIGAAIVFPRTAGGRRALNPAGIDVGPADVAAAAQSAAADVRGAVSIHVYGLNRLALVQARTRVVRRLEFLSSLIVRLEDLMAEVEASTAGKTTKRRVAAKVGSMQDRILQEMDAMAHPSAEYSATAVAWLRDFRDRTR